MDNPKFIITGMPRSGTTFLVALLFYLGFDIGYDKEEVDRVMAANIGALEYLRDRKTRKLGYRKEYPQIIKQPYIIPLASRDPNLPVPYQILVQAGEEGWLINHVFITKRDIRDNARSYIKRETEKSLVFKHRVPYGFDEVQLKMIAAYFEIAEYVSGFPYTYMDFPKFVLDAEYCYKCLQPVLAGIKLEDFKGVFNRLANPDLVHFNG